MAKRIVNPSELLEEVRSLLNLTIEDMCDQMNWPNKRYYNFIMSGRVQGNSTEKKPSSPTINKVFDGFNYAIDNYDHWFKNLEEIKKIVAKNLFPVLNKGKERKYGKRRS